MKIIKRLLWLIPFSLAGAAIAFIFVVASLQGRFEKWQSLGAPPEKAIKIVALDTVETSSGLLYKYKAYCDKDCWVETQNIPTEFEPMQPIEQTECIGKGYHPSITNFVDAKATCLYGGSSPNVISYINAIDKDGTVYSWSRSSTENGNVFFDVPYYGAILGSLVGIFVVLIRLLFDWIDWLQKKAEKKVQEV
jgi:hypothetical protein